MAYFMKAPISCAAFSACSFADAGLRRRAPSDGDGPGGQQVFAVNYESTAPHFHILFILLNMVTLEQHDVG
jgi:hypothetical protein